MTANIVPMPPLTQITNEDLEIAETACRDNAARCRRKGAIEQAASWERIADNIARAPTPRWPRRLDTQADLGDRHVIYSMCDPCGRP